MVANILRIINLPMALGNLPIAASGLPFTIGSYWQWYTGYLNDSSKETIFGSNKIKEQLETMKLQNEFYLKPWLLINWNRPAVSV